MKVITEILFGIRGRWFKKDVAEKTNYMRCKTNHDLSFLSKREMLHHEITQANFQT